MWHFDLYRLGRAEEAWELGIEEAFACGISLIEWPERLGQLLPQRRLEISLAFGERAQARRAECVRPAQSGGCDWPKSPPMSDPDVFGLIRGFANDRLAPPPATAWRRGSGR